MKKRVLAALLALVMLFVGCMAAYTFVWDLGDVGIGLMTLFNMVALFPLSGEALASLRDKQVRFTQTVDKDRMVDAVRDMLR